MLLVAGSRRPVGRLPTLLGQPVPRRGEGGLAMTDEKFGELGARLAEARRLPKPMRTRARDCIAAEARAYARTVGSRWPEVLGKVEAAADRLSA